MLRTQVLLFSARPRLLLSFLVGTALALSTSPAAATPLPISPFGELLPQASGRLSLPATLPSSLRHPDTSTNAEQLSLDAAWSNSFIETDRFVLDGERLDLLMRFSPQSLPGFTFALPVTFEGGGVLDSTIDRWHQTFGLPRGGRDRYPDNQFSLLVPERGIAWRSHPFQFSGPRISYAHTVALSSATSATIGLGAQLQSLGIGQRGQGIDSAASFGLQHSFTGWVLSGTVGVLHTGDSSVLGVRYAPVRPEALLAAAVPLSERIILDISLFARGELLWNVPDMPDAALYFDLGVSFVDDARRYRLALRENPGPHDGTVDVAFLFSITQ